MLGAKHYDAFISYSHKDNDVVKPLVELLSLNQRRVFWDQHLKAGDRWDEVIRSAVKQSSVFVIFWCCDTRGSQYVADEIALALHLKKKIVPVKLCAATMPLPLGDWQWIDLRQRVQHLCADVDHGVACKILVSSVSPQGRSVSSKRLVWISFAAVLLMIFLISSMMLQRRNRASSLARPAPASPVLETRFSRIPRGAVRLRYGYAVVNPPEAREGIVVRGGREVSTWGGEDGSITLLDKHGEVIARYAIPWGPSPLLLPDFQEVTIPWWYTNRAILFAGSLFAVTVALFTWMIMSHRRRASDTLSITMDYLRPLAHDL